MWRRGKRKIVTFQDQVINREGFCNSGTVPGKSGYFGGYAFAPPCFTLNWWMRKHWLALLWSRISHDSTYMHMLFITYSPTCHHWNQGHDYDTEILPKAAKAPFQQLVVRLDPYQSTKCVLKELLISQMQLSRVCLVCNFSPLPMEWEAWKYRRRPFFNCRGSRLV